MRKRLHECGAPGCKEAVRNSHLMCLAHWRRLPRFLRDAVTSAWDEGRRRDWSAAVLEARRWHAENPLPTSATLAARITGERL